MTDLYLIFFLVGTLLFGAIVAYSFYQQKHPSGRKDKEPTIDQVDSDLTRPSRRRKSAPVIEQGGRLSAPRVTGKVTGHQIAESKVSEPKVTEPKATGPKATGPKVTESKVNGLNLKKPKETESKTSDLFSGKAQKAQAAISRAKSAISSLKKPMIKKDVSPAKRGEAVMESSVADQVTSSKVEPNLPSSDQPGFSGDSSSAVAEKTGKMFTDADSVITDLVARVLNPNPIEQSDLISLFRDHDYKFHRKVHIYGLNELTDMWRDIEFELPSARFLELGISIQLCDRDGAMSKKELHDFQQMALQFCERYDAPFEFSMEIDSALKQAQALDQIGRRYDSMAVLNVVPKSKAGFRMADIQSCARDLMMSTDKSGIFMKTEGQKNNITVLFRLACTDGDGHFGIQSTGQASATPVHDLVVYMNVPGTRDPEMVFQQMVKDANDLAVWLDGKVVDRTGKAMTQRTYSTLMQQISDIAYSMQQDGLSPGDAVAKKLF